MDLSARCKRDCVKLPQINSKNRALSNKIFTNKAQDLISRNKQPQSSKFTNIRAKSIKALEVLHSIRIQAREAVHQNLESIQKRMRLIKELQEKYKIKFTQSELRLLSNESLEVKARIKYKNKLKLRAYHKIANWWKRVIIARKFQYQMNLVHSSATKIQYWWKSILFRRNKKIELKNLVELMLKSVIKIQANFRGFLVRKSIGIQLKMMKFNRNYLFFFNMKQEALTYLLKNILDIWTDFKVKEKYILLYKKIKEKEKSDIFSILKLKTKLRDTSTKILKIIKENKTVTQKKEIVSEPNSPVLITRLRDRSDTEDFFLYR